LKGRTLVEADVPLYNGVSVERYVSDTVYILALQRADDNAQAGGKAINLGTLLRAGFPVPGGFVVTTAAFRKAGSDVDAAIREAYRKLGDDVVVAVRSSATAEDMAGASMAGQYETFLDIRGEDAVIEAVKKCWVSISTPRTQAYLRQHNIDPSQVAMAVVVQVLVPAAVAGVMFTVNPRTGEENEILIEASYGLGESVVSGLVQPDTVILDKAKGAEKSYRIGSKEIRIQAGNYEHQQVPAELRAARCVGERELTALHALALKAEAHFGGPQDTEWAIDGGGRLYLLQSRAVTTLASAKTRAAVIAQTREMLHEWKDEGRGDWARHNLGETLPQPTPLTWSVMQRFMTPAGGFGMMYRLAGYEPSAKLAGFLDLIAGRIYMDLGRAPEMFFEGFPFAYDVALLRSSPAAAQEAPTIPRGSLLARMRMGKRLRGAGTKLAEKARSLDKELDEKVIPAFREWVAKESARDLAALSEDEWVKIWELREQRVMDEFAPLSLLPSLICGMALENLRAFLAPLLWDEDAAEVANLIAAGGPPDATLRSNAALFQLANGKLSVEAWLQENGHRAPEEFDLATPRWRERPAAVTALAQHLANGANPATEHESRIREARARVGKMYARLSERERAELDAHVTLCHRYLRFREDGKHELMRGYELLRQMVIDASRRLGRSPAEVCLLGYGELAEAIRDGAIGSSLAAQIPQRRLRREVEGQLALPDVIGEADIDTLGEVRLPSHTDRLEAFSLSVGSASGPVRIVATPESAGELGSGYILVCRSTDPSWTPLFVNAAGIVLECGGSLSHGAVVAREMGKPAVVLPNATQLLTEGATIAVDAVNGAVLMGGSQEPEAGSQNLEGRADDVRVAWDRVPPLPGKRERDSARLRNWFGVAWLVFLAGVFLWPGSGLRDLSMRALYAVLWPVYRVGGGLLTVAVIAVVISAASMVLQLLLTDTPRLREAKRRAASLKKEAVQFPVDSPRRRKLMAAAAPVQARLTLAAFVPLAVLLGPMVLTFLWLPERVDPASANPRPGATAIVTAVLDPEFTGDVTLHSDLLANGGPLVQHAASVKPTLLALLHQMERNDIPPAARARLSSTGKTPEELLKDLRKYVMRPLPEQVVTWSVPTPEDGKSGGVYTIRVNAEGGDGIVTEVVTGNAAPPPLSMQTDEKGNRVSVTTGRYNGNLHTVKIRYTDTRRTDAAVFFAPFAKLGWKYDFGWLGAYLLFYIVALFTAKRLLRVP
jgi:pyruvate,water dikinase